MVLDSQLVGFPPRGSVFSSIASGLEQGGVVLRISNSGEGVVLRISSSGGGVVLRISNSGGVWG